MATEQELREALEDMVCQFAYSTKSRGWPAYGTGGLSTLENAFDVLGWPDPYEIRTAACQMPRCREWATCGTPTAKGYKRVCGKHFEQLQQEQP